MQLDALETLFQTYLAEVDELFRKRKLGDGILGSGGGPQTHPCHERFDNEVGQAIAQLTTDVLSAEDTAQIVSFLLHDEALGHGLECSRWMLLAVQRHALPLIPRLSPADAKALLDWYDAAYPRFHRFPAQKEIIKALKNSTAR